MTTEIATEGYGGAGAFGVNYALRPHKFVDRRIFMELIARYATFASLSDHVYVGLGSFGMEDHKLVHTMFGTERLLSLEIDSDVLARQEFNCPLACIKPTLYSTKDFVVRKTSIFEEIGAATDANSIVWFDMTDADSIRAHLDSFRMLLSASEPGDMVRITVDVDEKTLGGRNAEDDLQALSERRFVQLSEMLGDQMKPGAKASDLNKKLGIANLALYAFRIVAEQAFERNSTYVFEPISATTYADGHRMLSVTGVITERASVSAIREKMKLETVPGGVQGWDELVDVQIPQLTVWEKLNIDREIHRKTQSRVLEMINFKLHETVETRDLLKGYKTFQRFYPTFRHVLL